MSTQENLLRSQAFKNAIAAIKNRAEKQLDADKLESIYVQTDLSIKMNSANNQLILGRRGTGKTHMARIFQKHKQLEGGTTFYINCISLGSGIGNHPNVTDHAVAEKYFLALLNEISTQLLDEACRMEAPAKNLQDEIFSKLLSLTEFFKTSEPNSASSFNYRQFRDHFNQVLNDLSIASAFVIIDEWAQVPINSQPYLAEFIKRSFFAVPQISFKFLAVNFQCVFHSFIDNNSVGIQRGADITDVIDLDAYLVYDENLDLVKDIFAQLLYNHIGAELGWDLSLQSHEKQIAVNGLFTQEPAFVELLRAGEGNARDFLCIFSRAYFNEFLTSTGSKRISIPNVEKAAASWFEQDKETNIQSEPKVKMGLRYIFDHVIKGYKSRTFMVESGKEEHPTLMRLLNERILHKLGKTYSHRSEPGTRFALITVDFGAYIRFKGTENEPTLDIFFDDNSLPESDKASYVPIDDRKSIRRILLDPDKLH